jgi:hypothetical protein
MSPAIHDMFVIWFCMGQSYCRIRKMAWKMATNLGKIAPEVLIYRRLRRIVVFVEVLERRNTKMFFKKF